MSQTPKASERMKRLLEDPNVTTAIAKAMPAIEAVLLEQQRTAVNFENREEITPLILAIKKNTDLLEQFAKAGNKVIQERA